MVGLSEERRCWILSTSQRLRPSVSTLHGCVVGLGIDILWMVLHIVIGIDWISKVVVLVIRPVLVAASIVHLVMSSCLQLALWSRLLNHSTSMVITIVTWYRSGRYEILLHRLTAVFYSITVILTRADWIASSGRSVCMGVVLVHGVVYEFILLVWGSFLEWLSLLVINLAVMVPRHDRALLIDVLLSLGVHWRWAIDTIPQIVMMLLKMVDLLISRVSRAHSLLPAPHVICYNLASVRIRLLNWALGLIWIIEQWLLLILI